MITAIRNIETTIFEFLPEYPFYLFLINDNCRETIFTVPATFCNFYAVMDLVVDLDAGVYKCQIFGRQDEEATLTNSDLLLTERLKVVDGAAKCFNEFVILDFNGLPLLDYDGEFILYQ